MIKQGNLSICSIQDYPDIRFRGVVEGFYGTPWSHEERMRQLEFYGRNKMNTYIYGPKETRTIHRQTGANLIRKKKRNKYASWRNRLRATKWISYGPYIQEKT